jgi:glycine/D-amino acid oxidase-like deaminating enzyme
MWEPDGVGIHALKLAFGYLAMARKLGARVHPASPVLEVCAENGVYRPRTPGGTVKARAVAFATAGYTSQGLHPMWLSSGRR